MNKARVFLFSNVRAKAHFWVAPVGEDDILDFGTDKATVACSQDAAAAAVCACKDDTEDF